MNLKSVNVSGRGRGSEFCFTPCAEAQSLLEETSAAVNGYRLSHACSSFDQFRYHQAIGEALYKVGKTTGGGALVAYHNPDGETMAHAIADRHPNAKFDPGFFEGKPRIKQLNQIDLNERTRPAPRQ